MTNNKNILRVLNGYLNLTADERRYLIEEINTFNTKYDKAGFQREVRAKLDVGPTVTDYCKCCGK